MTLGSRNNAWYNAKARIAWLSSIVFAAALSFAAPIDRPLVDGFHEGEYLAAHLYHAAPAMQPILVHGLMDVVPAALANRVAGPDASIAATRLINQIAGFAAAILFLAILHLLGRTRRRPGVYLLVGMAMLGFAYRYLPPDPAMHYGVPGLRDLTFFFAAWLVVRAERASPWRHHRAVAAAAFLAGLSAFWSYNRLPPLVLFLGLYLVVLAMKMRAWRWLVQPAVSGLAGLAANLAFSPDAFRAHLASMIYWQGHGAIWTLPYRDGVAVVLASLCCGGLVYACTVALGAWQGADHPAARRRVAFAVAISGAASMVLLGQINRLDHIHAWMAVPYTVVAIAAARTLLPKRAARSQRRSSRIIAAPDALALGMALAVCAIGVRQIASTIGMIVTDLPRNAALIPANVHQAAEFIRNRGGSCTLAFDNRATIYPLSGLRPCSRFMIPVYVGRDVERSVVDELNAVRPEAIVLKSGDWASAIDGIPQAARTPEIAAWIARNYTAAHHFGDIVVVTPGTAP